MWGRVRQGAGLGAPDGEGVCAGLAVSVGEVPGSVGVDVGDGTVGSGLCVELGSGLGVELGSPPVGETSGLAGSWLGCCDCWSWWRLPKPPVRPPIELRFPESLFPVNDDTGCPAISSNPVIAETTTTNSPAAVTATRLHASSARRSRQCRAGSRSSVSSQSYSPGARLSRSSA